MSDKEKEQFIASAQTCIASLRGNDTAMKRILVNAGIIDKSGKVTKEYQSETIVRK